MKLINKDRECQKGIEKQRITNEIRKIELKRMNTKRKCQKAKEKFRMEEREWKKDRIEREKMKRLNLRKAM